MGTYDRLTFDCSLADLMRRALPTRLHLLHEPVIPASDVIVRGTVIEGPGERLPDFPGAVLLLVLGGADAGQLEFSLREANLREFAAVIVRADSPQTTTLTELAASVGIAVIAVDGELSWRELAALLDAVIETHLEPLDRTPRLGVEELYTIADAVAATVGGSVSIEDLERRVVAYSSLPGQRIDAVRSEGILGRSAPADPGDRDRYGSIMRSPGVVQFRRDGAELARAAMAIRAGDLPLGSIWAIVEEGGITPRDEAALAEGARLAALQMLRARRTVELDQQLRGEALMALLDGTGDLDLSRKRLRVRPGEPRALLAFGFAEAEDGEQAAPSLARAAQDIARQVIVLRPGAAVAVSSSAIYVYAADPQVETTANLLAESITSVSSRATGRRLVGSLAFDPEATRDLADLRAEADDILTVLLTRSGPPTATLRDVRATVLLRHAIAEFARHPWLLDPALTEILDGSSRNRELVSSVAAWFAARFEISGAAQALQVHPNTLRYRLRRFSELTGVDLADADALLSLWLQLRTHAENATGLG